MIKLIRICFFLASITGFAFGSSIPTLATSAQLPSSDDTMAQITKFFSVFPDPATTYPTFTQLDNAVDTFFGDTLGLKQDSAIMDPIKRYYAYLKQQAAQECIERTSAPGNSSESLAQTFQNAQEKLEIARHYKDTADITHWEKEIATLTSFTTTVIEREVAPNAIAACRETESWQNHLKMFIANSYAYEVTLLGDINQDEIKMFSFLPQFETAYYTAPYTNVRNSAEYVRMFLVMTDILRERALAQCTDWSGITNQQDLYDKIEEFKASDFYTLSQKLDACFLGQDTTTTPLKYFSLIPATKTSAVAVSKGYRDYLECTEGPAGAAPTITARPGLEPLFSITNDVPALTALGSYLLKEGSIVLPKSSPYYGLTPTTNFSKLFAENEAGVGHVPTKLFIELISFNALRLINALIGYLFNTENLSDTLQAIYQLQNISPAPFDYNLFPNPIFYQPEDQLFLEEINALTSLVVNRPTPTAGGAAPAGFFSSLWHDIKSAFEELGTELKSEFKKIGSDLWHTVQAAGDFFVDLGHFSEDLGKGFYYLTGISALVNHTSYQGGEAGSYFDAAGASIHKMGADLMNIVSNVCDVAQQVVNMAGSIIAATVNSIDPNLGTNWGNMFDQIGALAIGFIQDGTNFLIGVTASAVALAFEAIVMIVEAVVGVIGLLGGKTQGFEALETTGAYFAKDLVTSILQAVTLFLDMIADALKNLMKAIGYLTAVITQLVIQIGGAIMGLESMATGGSFWQGYNEVRDHTRLISAIVGLVLMTIITIATMGTATGPMLAVGVGMLLLGTAMMAIGVVGANQQDIQANSEQHSQKEFLTTFAGYVHASEPAQYSVQAQMLNEMTMRLQEETTNSDRNLVNYQNYMNNVLNTMRSMQAYQLGSFYNILLTPDTVNYPPLGLVPGDTGYNYGIQTNRFDLNPSAGFRVYNSERGTFAQEIATLPAPLSAPLSVNDSFSSAATKTTASTCQHFITQKDFSNINSGPLTVTIRWRVIYESGGDFYIGIYLNNNYLDTELLNKLNTNFETVSQQRFSSSSQQFLAAWNPLNTINRYLLDFDNLALAFVCYQNEQTTNTPALGIYEHSDKQFIVQNQQPSGWEKNSWFKRGTWYQMTAQLNGTTLETEFSMEEDQNINWTGQASTTALAANDYIPYQALYQTIPGYYPRHNWSGSFGIITSGAAVEYEVIYPVQTPVLTQQRIISDTKTVLPMLTQAGLPATELLREQQWDKTFKQNLTPLFGGQQLVPWSEIGIAQGIYVYLRTITGENKKPITDYVVALANPSQTSLIQGIGQSLLGTQIGQPFNSGTQYIVSLVTGKCYNNQWQLYLTYPDALAAYQASTSVPPQLSNAINQSIHAYYVTEEKSSVFQNVTVVPVKSAFASDIAIYTCPSFTECLSGLDYLVFIQYPDNGQLGTAQQLPLSADSQSNNNTINSALSLVTGLLFPINTSNGTQITSLAYGNWSILTIAPSQGGAFSNPFSTYQQYLSKDPTLIAAITNQTNAYNTAVNAQAAAQLAAQQKAAQLAAQQAQQQQLLLQQQQPQQQTPAPGSLQALMYGSSSGGNSGNQGFNVTG